MKILNMLEEPVYPNLPESENETVGQISKDNNLIAWLAGIVDGEGCLTITQSIRNTGRGKGTARLQMRLEVRTTCPFMAQKITQILFYHNLRFFWVWIKPQEGKKEIIAVVVTAQNSIYKLLKMLDPFLTTKRDVSRLFLDYLDWRMQMQTHVGHNEIKKEITLRLLKLREVVRKRIHIGWSLQRLPREASEVIDLSKLEAVV